MKLVADAQQAVAKSQKSVAAMEDDLQRMVDRVKRYEKALRYIAFCCENDCDSEEPRDKAMTDIMDKARKAFLGG